MHKKYYYLFLCLSTIFIAPLAGNKLHTTAVGLIEARKPATAITVQSQPDARREAAVNNSPASNVQRPAQPAVEVKAAPSANTARPSANVVVQPQPAQKISQRPTASNRPSATNTRPATIPQPTISAPTRPAVTTSRHPRPVSKVILEKPRHIPAAPLPVTVKLDQRCSPYEFVMLRPYSITPKGNMIELVDGSVWHVPKKRDRRKVRRWSLYDSIVIESSSFFGWTAYSLVNYTRGESADATLTLGPVYEGHASHWVAQYDSARRFVTLEDGSRWSFVDVSFGDWRENDAVVLGLSKNESGQYVYMLINTRTMKSSLALNIR